MAKHPVEQATKLDFTASDFNEILHTSANMGWQMRRNYLCRLIPAIVMMRY
nr:hypothetical protein [Dickeya sp. NCPPB 3274]